MAETKTAETYHFHWADYLVFSLMLVASAATGVYYGYCKKSSPLEATAATAEAAAPQAKNNRRNETERSSLNEYLLGSRRLKAFPVAMSLIASYISGVTILGTPAEIYNFGTQYWLIIVPISLMGVIVSFVYLPVYTTLQVTSSYEYLQLRFNSPVRTIASSMFVLDEIFFLPFIIYVPALAFNQVTGTNVYLIGSVVTVVCIFYTILGGIKAVVCTDAWQVGVMFLAVVVIAIMGTVHLSGPAQVFDAAQKGGRLVWFNSSASLYERHTFMSVMVGGLFYWVSFNSVNQTMVQRYMAMPNIRQARLSLGLYTGGIIIFVSVCCYVGLLLYALFEHCDPKYAGRITTDDQLFPLFVMQAVGKAHGLPGLFIAGVFGAALSSLSVVLNSTATVILEDLIKGCAGYCRTSSERTQTWIVKGIIAILGVLAMLLVLVVEQLGGILVVATSFSAIAAGTSFGVFSLGMLVPHANSIGAISGMAAGAMLSGWVAIGSQIAATTGAVREHRMGVWTDECRVPGGNETFRPVYQNESAVFPLYRLSFHWINPIGVLTVLLVGTAVSYATGRQRTSELDARLLSPAIHRWLPRRCFDVARLRAERTAGPAAAAVTKEEEAAMQLMLAAESRK